MDTEGTVTPHPPISLNITATPVENIDQLARDWTDLESRSTNHSFFLSWHWIGSWLHCLPPKIEPLILCVKTDTQIVGLAIVSSASVPAFGKVLNLSQIALNATGYHSLDMIAIEYNGFLIADGLEEMVTRAALDWLLCGGVLNQTIQLNGIGADLANIAIALASEHERQANQLNVSPAPYVNLAAIRESGADYLSHLSRNSRQSLRRALRYYEQMGPVEYHIASTRNEALAIFVEMQKAHQHYWRLRGQRGAFSQPFFKKFHTELIKAAYEDGHIEIARITAGSHIIGYLYNFVWHGTVYAYQSGFLYAGSRLAKPGYVSHYMAITTSLALGRDIYDFMAGDRQHKSSLSTNRKNLFWLRLRSNRFLVRLENIAREYLY